MLQRIKNSLLSLVGQYKHLDSEAYADYARSKGCQIGEGTQFYGVNKLDVHHGPLITIGKNCKITDQVRLVAHTSDLEILQHCFGAESSPSLTMKGPIDIGDHVFIGDHSIITPNVNIGNNVIIGSGSVVTKDIPSDSVAGGNPCEVIMSLEEYRNRRVEREDEEIREYVRRSLDRDYPLRQDIKSYIETHSNSTTPEEFIEENN